MRSAILKIDMPNPYSVYMHDTDSRNLFADDYRFDSHGCTRVDNVRDLATWILQDVPPGWNRAAIDAGIATGVLKIVNLPHKIPVAWVYLTGWVTRDGTVQFREDVYKHDESLDRNALADAARRWFRRARCRRGREAGSNLDSRETAAAGSDIAQPRLFDERQRRIAEFTHAGFELAATTAGRRPSPCVRGR